MVPAESHTDRAGGGRYQIPHLQPIPVALEDGHVLRSEIHHGDHRALSLDASGVAADAALTLRVNRLNQFPAGVIDQQLVIGGVGRRDHEGALIGSGGNGRGGPGEQYQYAEKSDLLHGTPPLM